MTGRPYLKRHPYDQWSPDARALDLVGDKWTLLIVRDLMPGPRRFVELQRMLPGISTEQLRSRLLRMVADGLLTRHRFREMPPRVEYALTPRARELAPVVAALARWGFAWAWSAPRAGETVDVGAILRAVAPALTPPPALEGLAELVVDDHVHHLAVADGSAQLVEPPGGSADATVRGATSAWVAALGPSAQRGGLRLGGDRALAAAVLDGLLPAGAAALRAASA